MVAAKYLAPDGELLPHKLLDQQSSNEDNLDDVKSAQDNEEERTPTPSIRDDNVTLPGHANNNIPLLIPLNVKMNGVCLRTHVNSRCPLISLNQTRDNPSAYEKLLTG